MSEGRGSPVWARGATRASWCHRGGARVWAAVLLLVAAACSTAGAPSSDAARHPVGKPKIVNGRLELGREAVVFVTQVGGRCTGTLVGRRLVLTAKHCVQDAFAEEPVSPSEVSVGIGTKATDPDMRYFRVVDIVVAGGVYTEDPDRGVVGLLPDDIAVLTLQTSPNVAPLEIEYGDPKRYVGEMATAVGFGQTPGDAFGGEKFSVETSVTFVDDEALLVGSTVCPGDSGGPLIDANDRVIGVVSLGVGEECGVGIGYYNRVDLHEDLIMEAFKRAGEVPGVCEPTGPEVCDGFDNDCDEEVDEGCLPLGQPCSADDQCIGGRCDVTPMGRLCTASCDPLNPEVACPDGLRCALADECLGVCVPGTGGKAFGQSCERSDECASFVCQDPGDGERRCLSACRGGDDVCFSGEVCVAAEAACGSCVSASLVDSSSVFGFGEACDVNTDCLGGLCISDGELRYCSAACDADHECPGDSHCRDRTCVRGNRSTLGGRCVARADCAGDLFCTASEGGAGFCTRACDTVDDCGDGFGCDMVVNGTACIPARHVLGALCEADDACITRLCDDETGRCTRTCTQNAACGSGFECVRRGDSTAGVCLAGGVVPLESGGDGCGSQRGRAARPWLAALALGLLVLLRRRRAA